ncbi:MAG: helix-turn-helix domain-containing protein [Chloroflexota bacterium]
MSALPQLLTPQQVADYLQVDPETVYRYIRDGKLVASRFGRQYRILQRNLEIFVLAAATSGGAQLRTFDAEEIAEWIEEDRISPDVRTFAERLLKAGDAATG